MNRITAARKVAHAIDTDLDIVASANDSARMAAVMRLKKVNEELFDSVEELIKENERLKIENEKLSK